MDSARPKASWLVADMVGGEVFLLSCSRMSKNYEHPWIRGGISVAVRVSVGVSVPVYRYLNLNFASKD